jgi:hypothetical protein
MSEEEHGHSIYGASGASRWRLCPGSVHVIRQAKKNGDIPQSTETKYSKEGTEAHEWAEQAINEKIPDKKIPPEFMKHLSGYLEHCRGVYEMAKQQDPEATMICERYVPLFYRPGDRGQVDHAVICSEFIHVTDLKYGAGIKVDAEDNDQAQIYAISLIEELEIMEGFSFNDDMPVLLSIYQPRHRTFEWGPETWETTVGSLREAAAHIATDYKAAQVGDDDTLNPSDKACRFCNAKGVCSARGKTYFGGLPPALNIEEDFDFEEDTKEDLPDGKKGTAAVNAIRETLTHGQVAFICKNANQIKKLVEDVVSNEKERLLAGGEVRGMKLIDGGLGSRAWVDLAEAERFIKRTLGTAEAYKPRELITAPQALTKVKQLAPELSTIAKLKLGLVPEEEAAKSKTKPLIHRPEAAPKLVPD